MLINGVGTFGKASLDSVFFHYLFFLNAETFKEGLIRNYSRDKYRLLLLSLTLGLNRANLLYGN